MNPPPYRRHNGQESIRKGRAVVPTVTNTVEIKASPDEVWSVLADFRATRHWLPGTVDTHMDQDVRVCRMSDGQEIRERISDVDPVGRSFRFEHLRVALPVTRSGGTFAVSAGRSADFATVTLTTSFEPLDPTGADELAGMIRGAFGQALESLRRYMKDHASWDRA
jgi:uncharacterized protein YndB with AHSA1/START domain